MNYIQAREYFYGKENNFIDLGLDNIKKFLGEFLDPQDKLKIVQVAGTNGKGSTSSFLTNILIEAGYRTGKYSSPVVFEDRENISVDNINISKDEFIEIVMRMRPIMEKFQSEGRLPTIFELETVMAFLYYEKKGCDIVIMETGMGGVTDATNVSKRNVLSIITPISMDHMNFLGNTITEISEKKAGIIKAGSFTISSPQKKEVIEVLKDKSAELNNEIYIINNDDIVQIEKNLEFQAFFYKNKKFITTLKGDFQRINCACAIEGAEILKRAGFVIKDDAIFSGILNTKWRGRFEVINKDPVVIMDGAHNKDAAEKLSKSLKEYFNEYKFIIVMGVFADKDYISIIKNFTDISEDFITITSLNKRALSGDELGKIIKNEYIGRELYIKDGETYGAGARYALERYEEKKNDKMAILIFGSLSFLKDMEKEFKEIFFNENRK